MNMESIKGKIQKLLALSRDEGASEQEAELALLRAHELLAKYNLEMTDIKDLKVDDISHEKIIEELREEWIRTIYQRVAKMYFCKYYYSSGHLNSKYQKAIQHNVIGREHNRAVANEMTYYLIDTIKRLGQEHTDPIPGDKREINKIKRNFELGCAHRVSSRISTLTIQKMADNGDDKLENHYAGKNLPALYKTELQLCDDFLKNEGVRLSSSRGRANVTAGEAYRRGQSAGNSVSLNTQIKGGAASRRMLT